MASETTTPSQTIVSRFRTAYDATFTEMQSLPVEELVHINVDIPSAVTTALGAWPEIKAMRAEIAAKLPSVDLASFDDLERYALAVGHSQALYMVAHSPSTVVTELGESAIRTRDILFSDAMALGKRGLIDAERVVRTSVAYRNVAFDLLGLVALLRESWPTIAGKSAVQPGELDDAEQLADQLLTELGRREQSPAMIAEAVGNRQRAFTLFIRCYDQARRAIGFLRWEQGDFDDIAPSLYAGRGRKQVIEPQTDVVPQATQPATTQPAPASSTTAQTTPNADANATHATGMPGSAPYTR